MGKKNTREEIKETTTVSIDFCTLDVVLTIAMVFLRVTGKISWPWVWVLLGPTLGIIGVAVVVFLTVYFVYQISKNKRQQ